MRQTKLTGDSSPLELPLDLARLEDLEDVAFLHVLVALDGDAALVAFLDLADVVLEAPQRADPAGVDDASVAHQAHGGAAADRAVGDVGAGDRADARGAERLTYLGGADGLLDLLGREQALHGVAQLLDDLVDDRVEPDLDALAVGDLAGLADRAHVEADDHGVGGRGQHDVVLGDAADALADERHLDLLLRQPSDLVGKRLQRARDVGLDDQRQLGQVALLSAGEDVLQRKLDALAAGERLGLQAVGAIAGEGARLALVRDDAHVLAGLGNAVEAEQLDRLARRGLLDALPAEVVHCAHAAPVGPGHQRVADLQRAAHDQHRHDGPAARVELRLDDRARRLGIRVGLQLLELGQRDQVLEQVVEAVTRLGRHVDELGVAAPVGRRQADLGQLAADAVRARALLVDLVDGHKDRDLGGLGVVDRLARLRHHAVVGRDDDHRDVGDLGAAGAHGGERLVARRVEEGDRVVVVVDLVGADVLRDAACLTGGDLGLAHGVEQRRLAVVDVAHDRDDGRAVLERVFRVLEGLLDLLDVLGGADDRDLLVERVGQDLDGLVGQRLRERGHLAQLHQLLDDLRGAEAKRLADLLDGGAGVDLGRELLLDLLRLRGQVGLDPRRAAAPAAPAAGRLLLLGRPGLRTAGGLGGDDHAPAAARAATARGRARRALRGALSVAAGGRASALTAGLALGALLGALAATVALLPLRALRALLLVAVARLRLRRRRRTRRCATLRDRCETLSAS